MQHMSIIQLLKSAAERQPLRGLVVYPLGRDSPLIISYPELLETAKQNSTILRHNKAFKTGAPTVIYLNDHHHSLVWFWSVVLAGGIPTIVSPFSNIESQRNQQIDGLVDVLGGPLCITKTELSEVFGGRPDLRLYIVDALQGKRHDSVVNGTEELVSTTFDAEEALPVDGLAMLMLTSGSTGNAKAVRLTHRQVLAAVEGKALFRKLPANKALLNWIGADHVASVVEIHLPAMFLGVDQVHVAAADVITRPELFLDLVSQYEVARTFAPNFFMAKLIAAVRNQQNIALEKTWDLKHLTWMGSGGEANDVDVCTALQDVLAACGAREDVIVPGFGMTETCAGCIYNLECPRSDIKDGNVFASLGTCIPGAEMRITKPSAGNDLQVQLAPPLEPGYLEVRGAVVFDGYFNNALATAEAFIFDEEGPWFRTGDQAMIDTQGRLHMIGRVKETVNINGVKHLPSDIESTIERSLSDFKLERIVCFPFRNRGAVTESICVIYVAILDLPQIVRLQNSIQQKVMLQTGSIPRVIGLPDDSLLPKSTLGKISRAKMRSMFEAGLFSEACQQHDELVGIALAAAAEQSLVDEVLSEEQNLLRDDFEVALKRPDGLNAWGIDMAIFDVGVTSIDIIRLKKRIGERLSRDVPVITLMLNPTIRSLAAALQQPENSANEPMASYDPVVTLRPYTQGMKRSPLWLLHPGVGEVLVFLALSRRIDDRPVYALRARGFEPGEEYFSSIEETVETYLSTIKRTQPEGPYVLAGYSYGSMLAFELAKRLESNGAEISFLGCLNLPPHIKTRMRQLGWAACLLHLCYFLSLLTESEANSMQPTVVQMDEDGDRQLALDTVLAACSSDRFAELQLSAAALANWAMLAYHLQGMARDYEPSGQTRVMDIFHAIPLREAAIDREDWVNNKLSKWKDYVATEPRVHAVNGAHYTMLGPDHVDSFAETFMSALESREAGLSS